MKYVRSDLCEFPFLYKELALSSVLIPSFQDASDSGVVLAEVPIIRRLKNEESEGRIDYIVRHKGRNILIEVKHQWISYNSIKNGIKGKDKDRDYFTKEISEILEQKEKNKLIEIYAISPNDTNMSKWGFTALGLKYLRDNLK